MFRFGMLKTQTKTKRLDESDLCLRESIDLRSGDCSDKELHVLARVLATTEDVKELLLSRNKLTLQNAAFAKALANNHTLTTLSLWENEIGVEGAGKLADALKVNQTLQTIDLVCSTEDWGNQIGAKGAGKLSDALRVNQTLQEIRLGGNKIGAEGAGKLFNALKLNRALQIIHLGWNQIGNVGAGTLADALKVNQTIQKIYLRYNNIGADGAGKLADALKINKTLNKIDLGGNQIADEGAGKLAHALKFNQTLEFLDLDWNEIGIAGVWCLLDALKSNSTLLLMNLHDNATGNEAVESIVEDIRKILKDRKILNDPQRDLTAATKERPPDTQITHTPNLQIEFFSKLTSMSKSNHDVGKELQGLLPLISHTHMLKFFYTATSALLRSGALKKDEASNHIMEALEKSTELCLGEYEIASFKMILEKAKYDGHIDQHDLFRLDNRAEVKRIKNDPDILNLMETVKSNTARIEGLEANLEAVNNSVNKIRKGLKHKMKVEAAVGFLSATINAISFGVGGNVIDATAKALGSIVDFGDIVHIQSVAADKGAICVQQVEAGIEIAVDRYADRKLEKALKKGDILTVVSATAVMMNPISNQPAVVDAENLEAIGDSFFLKGDFTQAVDFFTRAISTNTTSCNLFIKRSAAHFKLGNAENALLDATAAVRLDHNYAGGHCRKGAALHKLGRYEEAEIAFLDGLAVSPDNKALKKALDCIRRDKGYKAEFESKFEREGNSSLEDGNFAGAVESFSKAIDLNGSAPIHFSRRCTAYLKMGDSEKALSDALSVVNLCREIRTDYCPKDKALHADDAISSFEEGIQKGTNDVELQGGLNVFKEEIETKMKDTGCERTVDLVDEEIISRHCVREENAVPDSKTTSPLAEGQRKSQSRITEAGDVEQWLLSRLPRLNKDDLIHYSKCLSDDGFYSVDMLNSELEEDDLGFMKKAHKRAVGRTLSNENNQ